VPNSYTYSDVDINLSIDSRGNVRILYDEEAVIQSIRILFATVSGEFVRSPKGSSLIRFLGMPINSRTATAIRSHISNTLAASENRITINDIRVTPIIESLRYDVDIDFTFRDTGRSFTFNTRLRTLEL